MPAMTFGRVPNKNRYFENSLETASPSALLVMLYDRLVLDLKRAEEALGAQDRTSAHTNLVHAQDIVRELLSSLNTDAWEGAQGLGSLYTWLYQEFVAANVEGDAERVRSARTEVVEPLAEAWRQAALEVLGATPPPTSA
ncbi:flagellar export chaperone FliS [Kineococcus aurantiacus]|uniref:Flagellar protein FliS n=1 Tax=Kineococcus aurantiacus TaxID=37633 RepID=A0A7Y9DPT5_9ACTN|nr:flagellar export chaperone FliS [Kineococcus aurantiacus]NYD24581.1 flagellar protein FliS [Kineococcus aurantiacus]